MALELEVDHIHTYYGESHTLHGVSLNIPRGQVVAHDMDFVFEVAERINVLYYGGLLASGTPDQIRNNAKVREIYMGLGENGTSA